MTVELRPGPLPSDVKPLPAGPITYEEFLEWADEDTCAEWVGGEVELMSPASVPHQDLSLFLARVLAEYTETHQSGKVLAAPFQMRLGDVQRGREPDILFIADNHLDRLRRNYLEGAADLVVEIVSPESVLGAGSGNVAGRLLCSGSFGTVSAVTAGCRWTVLQRRHSRILDQCRLALARAAADTAPSAD
jgi:hypothetical protein